MALPILAAGLSGCASKKAPPPAASAPQPISLPKPKTVDEKPAVIQPPDVKSVAAAPESAKALEVPPALPGPPKPKIKKSTKTGVKHVPIPVMASQPLPQPAAAAPLRSSAPAPNAEPELAPLLSDDRKNALLVAINDLVGKTEANLRVAEGHTLSDAQRELIKEIRTFLAQGQEARSRDLAAAKSLTQRAEILSRELLSQIK